MPYKVVKSSKHDNACIWKAIKNYVENEVPSLLSNFPSTWSLPSANKHAIICPSKQQQQTIKRNLFS